MPLPPPLRCLTQLPRALVLAGVLLLVGALEGGATVRAQEGATVELEPVGVAPGGTVTVVGSGFPFGETLTVAFGAVSVAEVVVDDEGAFRVPAVLPETVEPGSILVTVLGDLGTQYVLTYRVGVATSTPVPTASPTPVPTAQPTAVPTTPPGDATFEVLPARALPGATITVTGLGFGPGELVSVRFDGIELAAVGATSGGAFLANVVVPLTTSVGAHEIEVVGARGVRLTSEYVVEARVTPTATATAVPTIGPGGEPDGSGGGAPATGTPSGGGGTSGTGDGDGGVPSGGGDSGASGGDAGAGSGDDASGDLRAEEGVPLGFVAFLGVMAVLAGLLAWWYWRWRRALPPEGLEQVARFDDVDSPSPRGG